MPIKVKRAFKVAAVFLGFAAWFSLAHYSVPAFVAVSAIPILGIVASMLWMMFEETEARREEWPPPRPK